MQVQIFTVTVPESTTKFWTVPEYDIPIIKLLAVGGLRPDYQGNMPTVKVVPSGIIENRQLHAERLRIRRDWGTVPNGHQRPAWQEVYPTDRAFEEAYDKAVSAGRAILDENAKRKPARKPEPEMAGVGAPAAPGASDLFQAAEPRRRGRPARVPA